MSGWDRNVRKSPNELAGRFNDLGLPVNSTNTEQLRNENHISYNVAPTQDAPVYVESNDDATKMIRYMHWGVNSVKGKETFNAQWERVVSDKPSRLWNMMRGKHRCAIPVTGYYEWHTDKSKKKTPYYITRKDSKLVFLAGLYSIADGKVFKFTIITGPAPEKMKWLHHRMPIVIVPGTEDFDAWMDTSSGWNKRVGQSLKVFEGYDQLEIYEVNSKVGNVKNKGKDLISRKSRKMGISEMVGMSKTEVKSEDAGGDAREGDVKDDVKDDVKEEPDGKVKDEIKSEEGELNFKGDSEDDVKSEKVKDEDEDKVEDNVEDNVDDASKDDIKHEETTPLASPKKGNQTIDSCLSKASPAAEPHRKRQKK